MSKGEDDLTPEEDALLELLFTLVEKYEAPRLFALTSLLFALRIPQSEIRNPKFLSLPPAVCLLLPASCFLPTGSCR